MPQFLSKRQLVTGLHDLIESAEECLVLVSPYIKLYDEVKQLLSAKSEDEKFSLVVVFGKNKYDRSKSLSKDDMDFLKTFQNVEIYHNNDLHAKYYANEVSSLTTSLNLHEHSIQSNIEIGILLERKRFRFGKENRLDEQIFEYVVLLTDHSERLFERKVAGGTDFFDRLKRDNKREVHFDKTATIYAPKTVTQKPSTPDGKSEAKTGFCIHSGTPIAFNIDKPFCIEAYKAWNKDKDQKEHFCHFSGEPSDGKISFNKPVLWKYWDTVKELKSEKQ